MKDYLDVIRALQRPFVVLATTATVIMMWLTGRDVPQLLQYTWLVIVGELFGERLLLKLLGR